MCIASAELASKLIDVHIQRTLACQIKISTSWLVDSGGAIGTQKVGDCGRYDRRGCSDKLKNPLSLIHTYPDIAGAIDCDVAGYCHPIGGVAQGA